MDTILLCFANPSNNKLANLSEEDEKINSILSKRKAQNGDIDIIREQSATTSDVQEALSFHQNCINVFLYSGHAECDKLILENQDANAEGIAAMLKLCPNIKLVILNGCSTAGQVKALLDVGVPIVIATTAPIGDNAAKEFSIAFFSSMSEKMNSIAKAFEEGLAAAKTVSSKTINVNRDIGGLAIPTDKAPVKNEATWGIHCKSENQYLLEWRFGESIKVDTSFEPNKILLDSTWKAIEPFLNINNTVKLSLNDRIDHIITELPHPISDFLRKLIASPKPGEKEEFYNELSTNRLKYLLYTYTNCIDILLVTFLAQLWDEKSKGKINVLPTELRNQLEQLFSCDYKARKVYDLLPLIRELRLFFEDHNIEYFIEEFNVLSNTFNKQGKLYKACKYLQEIRNQVVVNPDIKEEQAIQLCINVEKELAEVLKEIGFLAKYKMASMKSIDFIKYKHNVEPRFRHNFVELRFRPGGMNIESETMEASVDNASVIFVHEKANGEYKFLNLSPFIFDINSFDEKAKLADLCMFLSYQNRGYAYRYIYKPKAMLLRVDKNTEYANILHDQINAFYQLIFQKSLEI